LPPKKKWTFEYIQAIPEKTDWNYSSGIDGENWVCSALVLGIMKEAGIFDNLDFNPKEFTPRDMYLANIYDPNTKQNRPQVCKEADPDIDYCMIMGKYRIYADHWNTVPMKAHMNERCASRAPDYPILKDC